MQVDPRYVPPPPQPELDPRFRVPVRLLFYCGIGFTLYLFVPVLLKPLFGLVIASTIGLFVVAFVTNLLTIRVFDRRPITDIGLGTTHGAGRNFVLGLVCGAGSAAIMLLAPILAGAGHLVPRPSFAFSWASLLFFLVALLFGAAGEEVLFRGYAFQILIEKIGPYATILPVAVLFGLGHAGNPDATNLSVFNTALWGALLGFAFLRSRDLWLLIGLHYGWNAVLPLFGVNLSGLTIEVTGYFYKWDLGPLWSGGNYGPEGGILTTIFVIALFFVLRRAPIVPQHNPLVPSLNEPD
jgi:uncharacterized protein